MTGLSVAHTARTLILLVLLNLRCCDSFRNLGVSNSNTRHDQSGTYYEGRSLHYFHSSLQSSRNTEMISKTQRIRNVKRRLRLPAMYINTLGIFALAWCMKIFTRRWIAIRASEKFCMAGGWKGIYATIPVFSALINMATNKLAVWMIFSPLEFKGAEWFKRQEGQPGTFLGWQGIVPTKVKKMGGDIADTLLNDLLDLKKVFARINTNKLTPLIVPSLCREINAIIKKEVFRDEKKDFGDWNGLYVLAVKSRTEAAVKRIIDKIKLDPLRYMDIKAMVVSDLANDKRLIVDLFQKCGRDELKFIVTTGFWGGLLLGVFQMAVWLLWDPWWSLALGGAAVGYLTDWFALKIMFEPVEAKFIGPFKIQGLFLQRQEEVSREFSTFMTAKLLTPEKIWNEISNGTRSSALRSTIIEELKAELNILSFNIDPKRWTGIADRVALVLPSAAAPSHSYLAKTLDLEETLRLAMMSMSSAQFETILHPVFQEDEATLIGVGATLGALSGLAQVPFY